MQSKLVGVWIDHESALLVSLDESGASRLTRIDSQVEPKHKSAGGARAAGAHHQEVMGTSHTKVENRRREHLHHFYQEVIADLGDAHVVIILGPGQAKTDLRAEMEKHKELASKIVHVEAADRMSERQLVARLRKAFEALAEDRPAPPSEF